MGMSCKSFEDLFLGLQPNLPQDGRSGEKAEASNQPC